MIKIPSFSQVSPRYTIDIDLGGKPYTLLFEWNSRSLAWYMTVIFKGDIVLSPVKLVTRLPLLHNYRHLSNIPEGEFLVVDTDPGNPEKRITFEGFGSRFVLLFVTLEEIRNGV